MGLMAGVSAGTLRPECALTANGTVAMATATYAADGRGSTSIRRSLAIVCRRSGAVRVHPVDHRDAHRGVLHGTARATPSQPGGYYSWIRSASVNASDLWSAGWSLAGSFM